MPAPKPKKPGIKVQDLAFYFDAIERDSFDSTGRSRRSAEILALRERLLRLPDAQFDAAMLTLHALVDDVTRDAENPEDPAHRRMRARTLYEATARKPGAGGGTGSNGKISPA